MPRRPVHQSAAQPVTASLEALVRAALKLVRTARKHRVNLAGENFYANKMIELRAEATNAFRDLPAPSAGDASAMAELIQTVFGAKTHPDDRRTASQQLLYSLRTTWRREVTRIPTGPSDQSLFPSSILTEAGRGYLIAIGRQMNGAFDSKWYDAAAVMMRRLLEISIIEAFEAKRIADKIKNDKGEYVHLSDLVDRALNEPTIPLSRNSGRFLPQLRNLGDRSAHGRFYFARIEDVERVRDPFRVAIEEFLRHAGLI